MLPVVPGVMCPMRDFHLNFFSKRRPDPILSLESELIESDYAATAGCYVLGSKDGTDFVYPWGRSPVFYIGTSSKLRQRLKAHRKWIRRARDEHQSRHFLSLHQYGASFGTDVAIYRRVKNESIAKFESLLITDFYNIYGAIPVANGAWPKLMRQPLGKLVT